MQVLFDIVGLKYLYDKIPINKIVLKNLKEYTNSSQYNFDNEINNFTNLRQAILVEQYRGDKERLLNLYKEYLFYLDTFKRKKLIKRCKLLNSNDIFQKNAKVEYDFEEEIIIILYNIGLLKTSLAKTKNEAEDAKAKNKLSNESIEIFHYLFENINSGRLKGLMDINCVSCYIFLSLCSAYHENTLYNAAVAKKYKRNLLMKLAYNIYAYFNNILNCLDGKMIKPFQNSTLFNNCLKNLQYIRNANGYFYNYVLVNKLIFISVSNYHAALKYVELSDVGDMKVKNYEADKIGEIMSRLQYSLGNVNKSIEICKKLSININSDSLKSKIEKLLKFFEYENTHIYFESIPEHQSLDPLKGTEVIKIKNVTVANIYTKKNISPMLSFLFNEKSKKIYEAYSSELQTVFDSIYKKIIAINDQYKLMKLSYRKNVASILNRTIINTFNAVKRNCLPAAIFEEKFTQLQNIEKRLQEIIMQADSDLQNENKNHIEFQNKFSHICRINQDSLNSYNNFLFHLENFKKSLMNLQNNNSSFKTFFTDHYSTFQICDMDVNAFFEYIIAQLNHAVDLNVETIEKDYTHFKTVLTEETEQENKKENEANQHPNGNLKTQSSICSSEDFGIKAVDRPSLNYSSFTNFLNANNLNNILSQEMTSGNALHENVLRKYVHVQMEKKIYFIIVSLYFSLNVMLAELNAELNVLKNCSDEEFINELNEETDSDKLQEILLKQKEKMNEMKKKIEDKILSAEHEVNAFYGYCHEYNKLEVFKSIDEINAFVREFLQIIDKINKLYQADSAALQSALLFRDDINKYIFMRESERSKIRLQPSHNYQNHY